MTISGVGIKLKRGKQNMGHTINFCICNACQFSNREPSWKLIHENLGVQKTPNKQTCKKLVVVVASGSSSRFSGA